MIFATVDIGSNAGRLLISNVYQRNDSILAGKISLVRVPLRLGMDVFEKGYISEQKQDSLIKTFKAYNLIREIYQPVDYIACATAAMREATNKEEVLKRIENETGNTLQIIDGIQEANIISKANNININKRYSTTLYIDVGGGSTECSVFFEDKFVASNSFSIGTIRLLFDKVDKNEWDRMKLWLKEFITQGNEVNCICAGGNISKLVKLFGNYDNTIDRSQLKNAIKQLEQYTLKERMHNFNLRLDRADVIAPAAYIYRKIMKWSKVNSLIAPRIGLADGLAIELFKKRSV
ncbi:MAG TPA: Ppx/GppA family phosphatase [Bacteroidales bacterium]|jgi:exopolyphosphatase/guanosine-5'-triphosphate,3'-diphosphate pyrophosphatase|nr:Ppx/GppA family phosphatase [Bacteroidales bacterium]HXK80693.1 Ppx/GppA family phosphatase [Bacteroidales bacterium]